MEQFKLGHSPKGTVLSLDRLAEMTEWSHTNSLQGVLKEYLKDISINMNSVLNNFVVIQTGTIQMTKLSIMRSGRLCVLLNLDPKEGDS